MPPSTPNALFPLHTPSSLVTRKINSAFCVSRREARSRADTLHSPHRSDKARQTWNFYFEHRKWLINFQNRQSSSVQNPGTSCKGRCAKCQEITFTCAECNCFPNTCVLRHGLYPLRCCYKRDSTFTARYDSIFKYNPHYCLVRTNNIDETNTWQ